MKHKHAELIHKWADGADIQVKHYSEWKDVKAPLWDEDSEYRVKPPLIKREGYVNVYPSNSDPEFIATTGNVFPSFESAVAHDKNNKRLATTSIEWFEWNDHHT